MIQEKTDKLFDTITSNGCREMGKTRFHQAINEALEKVEKKLADKNKLIHILKKNVLMYKNLLRGQS